MCVIFLFPPQVVRQWYFHLVMRLFKPVEHLQAAFKAAASAEHPIEQFTTIGRQLGYFGYLSLDMIVWVCFFFKKKIFLARQLARGGKRTD
jgi:hypothetical protein